MQIPFKIGEQYENWEFALEPLKYEIINGLDAYKYLGEINFYNQTPKSIKLVFSLDILTMVIFTFSKSENLEIHQEKTMQNELQKSQNNNTNYEIKTKVKKTKNEIILYYGCGRYIDLL